MNPSDDSDLWARVVQALMENLIAAAGAGARDWSCSTTSTCTAHHRAPSRPKPFNPVSRKGEIRAKASELLTGAERRGEGRAAIAVAWDLFGPGGHGTHFAGRFWKPAFKGKTVPTLFDPDATHSYNYIPDVASGLAALGLAADTALLHGAWP